MSILDRDYSNPHEPWMCECGVPMEQYEDVKQHEHAAFKPITSLGDLVDHIVCNANNMPSAGGLLFGSYVVQHYSDDNYETSHLIDLLAKIVPPTIDSGYYYKFVHLYNCARSSYEDLILSSVSCDIDSFTKKDFEKLDDFINNVGSIFDDLVTHILTVVLESD